MTGKRLLIVAHAPSPNTERLRDALIAGARSPEIEGVEVTALSPFATTPADVLSADAIILGATENLGYMSGDQSLYTDFGQIEKTDRDLGVTLGFDLFFVRLLMGREL